MAKLSMNSSDLLESIKSRAQVPISQIALSDDDLLRFATEEIQLKVVPSVLSVREEFYVTEVTVPMVANQSNYKIPYRAIGGKVRFVYFMQAGTQPAPMAQIPMEELVSYQNSSFTDQNAGFYLQNDELIILPPVSGVISATLRFKYYLKPNTVVKLNRGARISSINTSTGDILVETVPSNITAASEIDFIGSTGNFKNKGFDIIVTAVSSISKLISVSPANIPADLQVGDYICTAGETVIPQVPAELQVMVAQAVACRILEAIGDTQGLQNANAKLTEMEVKLLAVIDSRVESPGRKVINPNSFLRNNRFVRRWIY